MRTSLGNRAAFGPMVTRLAPFGEARDTFVNATMRAE